MEESERVKHRIQSLVDDVIPSPRVLGIVVAVGTGVLFEAYDMFSNREANYWAVFPLSSLSGYVAYRFFRDRYELLKSLVRELLRLRRGQVGTEG
ncbi:MAG: hypothetical protein NXH91_18195 [Phyllobacteriaceae bacterium]|nr:hypothetical protein [Phyllobacteriaceae bacterium]